MSLRTLKNVNLAETSLMQLGIEDNQDTTYVLDVIKTPKNIKECITQLEKNYDLYLPELKKLAQLKLTNVNDKNTINSMVDSAVDVLIKLIIKQKAAKVYIFLYHLKELNGLRKQVNGLTQAAQAAQAAKGEQCTRLSKEAEAAQATQAAIIQQLTEDINKLKAFVKESSTILDQSSDIQNILDENP